MNKDNQKLEAPLLEAIDSLNRAFEAEVEKRLPKGKIFLKKTNLKGK